MGKRADHACGRCSHKRGVHVPSLGRCLGPRPGASCDCSGFRRADPPPDYYRSAPEPEPEAPCAKCGSPYGRCRCRPSWEQQDPFSC
jgi:hypothetical protein